MPAGEIHVQLAANYAGNRKVRRLMRFGADARLARDLYVQMLCYCKTQLSDGFVPAEEIGLLVYPDPVETGERNAQQLVEAELIEVADGGYFVTGWFKRNRGRAEIRDEMGARHDDGLRGNHLRWHAGRGKSDPRCEFCTPSDRGGDRRGDRLPESGASPPGESRGDVGGESSETETETVKTKTSRPPAAGFDADPDWTEFWTAYPKKVDKIDAQKQWRAALRRHVEPKTMIAAAEAYASQCAAHGTDKQFIKGPARWLRDGSYDNDFAAADDHYDPEDLWNTP